MLKLEYARVEPSIRWEGQEGNQFPHLHGRNFGAGEVVSSHCFVRAGTQAWSDAVKGDSWLE